IDAAAYFTGDPPDNAVLLAGLSDDLARRESSTVTYREYVERLTALEDALRANGQWWFPHPWLATFVGDSVAEAVVASELEAVDLNRDLGPLGQVVVSPLRAPARSPPRWCGSRPRSSFSR